MVEKRVAVTLPGGPKVSDTIARAQWAEAEGYSDAWLADGGAPDAMTLAAILGDHTERLRVGIAVTPVYTRAPSVLAATAYTVAPQLPGAGGSADSGRPGELRGAGGADGGGH